MRYMPVMLLVLLIALALPLPMTAQEIEGREIKGLELVEHPAVQFWFKAYAGHYPFAQDRLEQCQEHIASDAKQYETRGTIFQGVDGICTDMAVTQQLSLSFDLETVVTEGDFVAVRYTSFSPSNKGRNAESTTYPAMVMFHLENDQLQEIWNYFDWCDTELVECQ